MINTSRIMPVLKVETDSITSIAASLIGTYVILVIIYVEPYKTWKYVCPICGTICQIFLPMFKKKGGVLIYLLFDLLVFIKYELLSVIRAFAFDIHF
jgi:hypothetical protein